jgi:hypothetical protein
MLMVTFIAKLRYRRIYVPLINSTLSFVIHLVSTTVIFLHICIIQFMHVKQEYITIQYVRTKHRLLWQYGLYVTNAAYMTIQFVRTDHHAHDLLVTNDGVNVALCTKIKPGGVMF